MRWKTLPFLIVFSLFAALAFADSQITVSPIQDSITLLESASYKLTITNNAAEKQRYSIFSFVQGWDIEPSPLKNKVMEIQPSQTASTNINVKPTESFNPGLYSLALNIETDLGEKYIRNLPVYVNPEKPLDYLPSIKVEIDMDKKLNPQELQTIKLLLENKNPLNMPELVIILQSDIPEFNKQTTLSLAPLETKTVEFTVTPNSYQSPGEYFLFFTFEKDGESVKVIPYKIDILPVNPQFQTEILEETSFLKTTQQIIVINPGNIKDTQDVNLPTSLWKRFFTSSEAKPIKENGQRYLSWELTLSPNETITVTATQNYRYPFYLLILIILFTSLYFYLKSPFTLAKKATSSQKDATLSELKITLDLKNISHKNLKNIEVIDLVPGIADIEKGLDIGTLKPQEIKHTKKGTLVKWKLAEIDAKEHRMITYQVRSKLKIVGALKLPRAKVVYHHHRKRKTAYSNTFRISS